MGVVNFNWPPEAVDILVKMLLEGKSHPEIQAHFGFDSRNKSIGKANNFREKLKRMQASGLSDAEIADKLAAAGHHLSSEQVRQFMAGTKTAPRPVAPARPKVVTPSKAAASTALRPAQAPAAAKPQPEMTDAEKAKEASRKIDMEKEGVSLLDIEDGQCRFLLPNDNYCGDAVEDKTLYCERHAREMHRPTRQPGTSGIPVSHHIRTSRFLR